MRQYILKITTKLEDVFAAPQTEWTITNHLLYNKKIPAIPPLLVDTNFVSDFNKKANNLSLTISLHECENGIWLTI